MLELLDFTLEECYWTEVNPARLAGFMGGVPAVQVGKILTKLSNDDKRVKVISTGNRKKYTVPLKRSIYNHMKTNQS